MVTPCIVALDELRKQKIIIPGMTTIKRVVWEVRQRAEEKIYKMLISSISMEQIDKLENILSPMPESNKTYLAWQREVPGTCSPDAFLKIIEKLEYIRKVQLQIDTKGIHPNRFRQLSKIGARYEPQSFRRFDDPKKYATLVAYLLDLTQDLTDQAFEIHDRQILQLHSKGRKAQEEIQKHNGKSINEKVVHYADPGAALIKARDEGIDPFIALETVMPWEQLVASVEEAKRLARPIDYDYLDLLEKKFYTLRKYTPTLLKTLEFRSTKSAEPLMKAIDVIRDINETGKRKVPKDAPLNFVTNRWQKHVYDDDGTINRHYYEMAVITELRNYVRSGDVSIVGSRQHKDFDEYLVSKDEWSRIQPDATKLVISMTASDYLAERTASLIQRLEWVSNNIKDLEGINVEQGKLHISRLEKDTPEDARNFSSSFYESSFYSKVINTNARDAVHVIDGLLHHETDLTIEEHYTDTAGYTDQVFGLTQLLGFRFAPRLRDLSDSRLYTIGKPADFPKLEKLLRGQINTKGIQENYDEVLRLAHSIREGTVSASLIMGKIGSYSRQNRLATALREMGRIEKTIFILDYISSEALRRKIHRGLNKGEAMNALARAIFFGKHGELRERALQDQLQRASALNILINAISVWNTVYLSQATEYKRTQGTFKEELMQHTSPLGWEHINFLGEYKFDLKQATTLTSLRPLKKPFY